MRRRTVMRSALVTSAALAAPVIACAPPPMPSAPSVVRVAPEAVMLRPAREAALTLADLPSGFRLAEELTPTFPVAAAEDPWGRVSAYSATYIQGDDIPAATRDEIVCSINTYASADRAHAAFLEWQAAVPRTLRPQDAAPDAWPHESAVFCDDRSCLAGVRVRNVMASIWVGVPRRLGSTVPDEHRRSLDESARRLTFVAIARIEALASAR